MAVLEDLYRDTILRHYQSPTHRGRLAEPDAEAFTMNPLCGDEMRITAQVDDGSILDLAFEARGCSISQASADMMADVVVGRSLDSATQLASQFNTMMSNSEAELSESLGDLAALQHIKKYPVRVKCALLPWNTLLEALRAYESSPTAAAS